MIIYNLHYHAFDDRIAEFHNFAHFLKFGLLPPSFTAEGRLYDGVDFIFVRVDPLLLYSNKSEDRNRKNGHRAAVGVSKTTKEEEEEEEASSSSSTLEQQEVRECQVSENIRIISVPRVHCDLCAHALVLKKVLGYKRIYSLKKNTSGEYHRLYKEWPYKSIVMLNSGVLGPIYHASSSSSSSSSGSSEMHWTDILGMAGQASRTTSFEDHYDSFDTVAGSTMSWLLQFHLQSYFLVVPC